MLCLTFLILQNPIDVGFFGLITLLFMIVLFLFVGMQSKKGFFVRNGELYIADFFSDRRIYKRKVKFKGKSTLTVLSLNKRQKTVMTAADPDSSYRMVSYDLYLLNEKHTQKTELMTLRSEIDSERASEFITKRTKLVYEIYSPDFG